MIMKRFYHHSESQLCTPITRIINLQGYIQTVNKLTYSFS